MIELHFSFPQLSWSMSPQSCEKHLINGTKKTVYLLVSESEPSSAITIEFEIIITGDAENRVQIMYND